MKGRLQGILKRMGKSTHTGAVKWQRSPPGILKRVNPWPQRVDLTFRVDERIKGERPDAGRARRLPAMPHEWARNT